MRTFLALAMLLFCGGAAAQPLALYPGDTNNDSFCNYLDLIPVGLAYGETGPRRFQFGSNNWAPQQYDPWIATPPLPQSEIDKAFANAFTQAFFFFAPPPNDTVNSNDVGVIRANYGNKQFPPAFSTPPPEPYLPKLLPFTVFPPPRIEITFSKDTVDVLDTFYAQIAFIGSNSPSPDYHGVMAVALRLKFAPVNFEDNTPRLLFDTLSTDLMAVGATFDGAVHDRALPAKGVAELAVSGYAHNAFKPTRPVAALEYILDMIIRSDAPPDTLTKPFWIEFDEVVLVDTLERRVATVLTHSDTIILRQIITAAPEPGWQASVRLSPNPARERVAVESGAGFTILKATVWDTYGRQILVKTGPAQRLEIPLAGLPPGVFWVDIATERGRVWQKLTVLR